MLSTGREARAAVEPQFSPLLLGAVARQAPREKDRTDHPLEVVDRRTEVAVIRLG
jgi:hypothetical protein